MAMIVRGEHDLPTIRVLLRRRGGQVPEVVFNVVRGRGAEHEVAHCQPYELGLTDTTDPRASLVDEQVMLPGYVWAELEAAVSQVGSSPLPPESAVWLELPSPRGYLYLLPWERMLARLGRPVLRLPNHTLRPQAKADTLQVAVCASAPMAKTAFDTASTLDLAARVWLQRSGHQTTVHLFTDQAGYGEVRDRAAVLGSVEVHDPSAADRYLRPQRTRAVGDASAVTNPWLQWIRDALQGRALDAVHFIAHGYLSGDRGAIGLASTPTINTDMILSRFIGAAELSGFLTQVGAWSLVLSGPPANASPAGLRALADAIALVHPGVSLVNELALDDLGADFGSVVEMVYGDGAPVVAAMPGLTCWVHPRFVEYPEDEQEMLVRTVDGRSALIGDATQDVLGRPDTPAWVAAATRYLESQQADWMPEQSVQVTGTAQDPDAVAALSSVSRLLDRHASRHLGHLPDGTA